MNDPSQPYVWNPASQRYERSHRQQENDQPEHHQREGRDYSGASPYSRFSNYQQHPLPAGDWNPWAYLDCGNQQPYTPSQPAVGADLPTQYDPYRLPSIQEQGLADAYGPYEYQASAPGSSYAPAAHRSTATAHQGQLPYLVDYYNPSNYHGWIPESGRSYPTQAPREPYTLPPLDHRHIAIAVGPPSTAGFDPSYASTHLPRSIDLRASTSSGHSSHKYPESQARYPYNDYSSSTRRSASADSASYLGPATHQRSGSDPLLTWEEFQRHWKDYIRTAETALEEQAQKGELVGFVYHNMAQPLPSLASCDDLVRGLTDSYRLTVERLKQLIRGIQLVPNLPYPHPKVSGNKQELINRIIDILRSLKTAQSPAYYDVAKLVGEAQGITYQSNPAATSSVPHAGTSAPTTSYGRQYGSSTYGEAATNTMLGPTSYSTEYAVRPSQFGLARSPGRTGSAGASGYGPASSSNADNTNPYYQHGRPYSNSPHAQYRSMTGSRNGASVDPSSAPSHSLPGRPAGSSAAPASSHYLPSRPAGSNGYAAGLSSQIPTSLPVPLPPKSALAGQPAIPMNFKPSPFFNVISAVSTVTTLPRTSHGHERASGTANVYLTEDQRMKLATAREDPKAPQYQLRLYCTSGDFYHPHNATYGAASRQALPIEFPLSSEAKMNDVAVIANLRGIKKKPGTAPPAHVSNAKVGNPSRTTSSSTSTSPNGNAPVGSFALKLGHTRETNKVELVYMNTEKAYYMIVYFVEAFSVEQVVEKIKKDRFRQKEDVLKSIHRAAEDPDIQATSSTISMKDPLTYTTLNTPIRSINCPHLQCFDAFCFLSMMESTPDWKCPVCNRAIAPSIIDLVHDGFFQDIKNQLPSDGSIDTVIVEVDGTWRTEDYRLGNSRKALEFQHQQKELQNGSATENGSCAVAGSGGNSRGSSLGLAKDGTPLDVKPDIKSGSNASLTVRNGRTSRGQSKSRTPAAIIELDDDDDDYHPYGNDDTPPPPSRSSVNGNAPRQHMTGGRTTAGKVIDLTLSDSEEEDDGRTPSIVGLGSRAPSIRTPGGGAPKSSIASLSIPLTFSRTPTSGSAGATTLPSSEATVNGNAASDAGLGAANQVAGVKRRHDSEALYDDVWKNDPTNAAIGDGQNDGDENGERASQVPRYG